LAVVLEVRQLTDEHGQDVLCEIVRALGVPGTQ
jgi:hypothetical protein